MADTVTSQSGTPPAPHRLLEPLSRLTGDGDLRMFAVLDGAWFHDVSADLNRLQLVHRPLYREGADNAEIVRGGPWLVDLNSRPAEMAAGADLAIPDQDGRQVSDEDLAAYSNALSARMLEALEAGDETGGGMLAGPPVLDPAKRAQRVERIVELLGDSPAGAFWIGGPDLTADLLHRHLRGLNQVRVVAHVAGGKPARSTADLSPAQAAFAPLDDIDLSGEVEGATVGERYILRHADPNVLLQVLPTLTDEQLARFMGPADRLVFGPDEDWGGGVKSVRRPVSAAVSMSAGPLTFTQAQIEAVETSQLKRSRYETMLYLREQAGEETAGMSDEALYRHVYGIEQRGFALGLESLSAHLMFAFMCTVGMGDEIDSDAFRQTIAESGLSADDALSLVFDQVIEASERDEEAA